MNGLSPTLRTKLRPLAWAGVVLSFPVWGAAFVVAPFLPLSVAERGAAAAAFIAAGEALFWAGALVLGADVVARFRGPRVRTGRSFAGKRVAVVGAAGGLGSAIARAVSREGGTPVLVVRDAARVDAALAALGPVVVGDLSAAGARAAAAAAGTVDHVIVAAGVDVRLPLAAHSDDDVARQLDVGLAGPIHVARAFLPALAPGGTLAFLGGFGDGSLAMPYASADVAARAGLAGFCAALNRELRVEERAGGRAARACYVGPLPADTDAERPYLPVWRALGAPVTTPDSVADFVLAALVSGRRVAVMGRSTRALLCLGSLIPAVVDHYVVRRWGPTLRDALGDAKLDGYTATTSLPSASK